MTQDTVLQVKGIRVRFGGLVAVDDVSVSLQPGEVHAIIGPNGAGKTTLMNVIAGRQKATTGKVLLGSVDATGWSAAQMARAGVARTFQNVGLFRELTSLENILLALAARSPAALMAGMAHLPAERKRLTELKEYGVDMLRSGGLLDSAEVMAGAMSYGQQRLLEVTRALAMNPRILLLDEPGAGLNQTEKVTLVDVFRALVEEQGISMFLIDHNMRMVMAAADRVTVLDRGKVIFAGTPDKARRDERVIQAYLGREA